jgi:hypothetical protein
MEALAGRTLYKNSAWATAISKSGSRCWRLDRPGLELGQVNPVSQRLRLRCIKCLAGESPYGY